MLYWWPRADDGWQCGTVARLCQAACGAPSRTKWPTFGRRQGAARTLLDAVSYGSGPAGCFAGPRGGYGLGAFGKKVTTHVTAQTPRVIYLRPEELTNIHLFVKTERLMIAMGM